MVSKELPPMKPPAPRQPAKSAEEVAKMLADPNYGKPQANPPAGEGEAPATGATSATPPAEPAARPELVVTNPPAPAVEAPAKPKRKPWEDLSHGSKGLSLPMHPELYAKMRWITENVPKMSLQKIAKLGAEKIADELIAKHYDPAKHDE